MVRGAVWGEVFLLLFGEVVFLGLWVTVLGLRWLCAGVTHPRPLSRGEVCGAAFLLVVSGLWCVGFPYREGIEGCVMGRGAVWVEMFLLLFGEVVFLGFGWMFLVFRWLCLGVTHPRPLFGTGRFGWLFLVGNEWFEWGGFPSREGIEGCGMGGGIAGKWRHTGRGCRK